MQELTYIDENGKEVKTVQFLRNRGTCCKTACRHCPYGFTLRNKGLQFSDYSPQWKALAEKWVKEWKRPQRGIATSLLAEGLGHQQKAFSLDDYPAKSLKFILLKGKKIGLAVIPGIQVKEIFLSTYYQNQGIDIAIVESFYF